jgi:hypothetical protein
MVAATSGEVEGKLLDAAVVAREALGVKTTRRSKILNWVARSASSCDAIIAPMMLPEYAMASPLDYKPG